jgi:hypothetical protein
MIRNGDISNQAKIDPVKLRPGDEAQLLIAQNNGRFKAVTIKGDASLTADGRLKVTGTGQSPVIETNPALSEPDLAENEIAVGDAVGTKRVDLGTGANAIPQRDSSGNLNADKLDNQDGTYYTDSSNHTSGAVSATTNAGQGLTYATQTKPFKELVANFDFDAQGSGFAGTSLPPITHNFGYIPTCKIYKVNGSNLEEIELSVVSTTTTTTISFNYLNHDLKVILR